MNALTTCKMLTIETRKTLALDGAEHTEVSVARGCVWITQYGSSRDVVLSAGESAVLDLPTATLITSAQGARLMLIRREKTARKQPLWRRLAGLFDPRWSNRALQGVRDRLPAQGVTRG